MITSETKFSEWERNVIRRYMRARNKTEAEVITRLGLKSCWRAVTLTQKASLTKPPLSKTYDPEKGGRTPKQRAFYKIMAARGHKRGQGIKAAAKKEYGRRRSAKGAMAAGFFNAIRDLGGKPRSRGIKERSGGTVAKSFGRKAYPNAFGKTKALAVNKVEGSGVVAKPAMDRAIRAQLVDMDEHVRKLQQTDNKFSARKR